MDEQIKISHPEVENYGYVSEESLETWLDLGWTVVAEEDEEQEEAPDTYVTQIDGEDETMVLVEEDEPEEEPEDDGPSEEDEPAATEETPLPDEKESGQDDTEDPKE